MSSTPTPIAAITFSAREAAELDQLDSRWLWTGWKLRHWPADILRPGVRLAGFNKTSRRLFVLLDVTHGGAFTYRTQREFSRRVEEITDWRPDLSAKNIPVSTKGDAART